MQKTIAVATVKSWNIALFANWRQPKGYSKHLFTDKRRLTLRNLQKLGPKYVFFLHWSWIIPREIFENFTCVVFHMTDLPFGRGGSPLQNLIIRGTYKTRLSAIKVDAGIDSGPVYIKQNFDLSKGSAQQIFEKCAKIDFEMINKIVRGNLKPKPQRGKVVLFKRRSPKQSEIPQSLNLRQTYDFIRMLDAEGYPKAFINFDKSRFEFSNAKLIKDKLTATVQIFPNKR